MTPADVLGMMLLLAGMLATSILLATTS